MSLRYIANFCWTIILLVGCTNNYKFKDLNVTKNFFDEWYIDNKTYLNKCCGSEENISYITQKLKKIHAVRNLCFFKLKTIYGNEIIRKEIEISEDYSEHNFEYYFKLRID